MSTAELGLSIDSSQARKASVDLDQFAASAAKADAAAGKVVSGATTLARDLAGVSAASAGVAGKMEEAAHAHVALSTQAMAASHAVRGFAEMMAQGVPVTRALAMEANNISYAMSHPGGLVAAFKEGASVFTRFLTPTTAAIAGVVALSGVAVLGYESWKSYALGLDDVSKQAGTTVEEMSKLQSAASFQGIDSDKFQAGIAKFSTAVYDAQHGVGALAETMRANGESARTFGEYMGAAANIIARAGSEQEKLQLLAQMGLPATQEWVRLLQDGSDGLRQATDQAVQFGGGVNAQMVNKAREFDKAWDRGWTNFKVGAYDAVTGAVSSFDSLILKAREAAIAVDKATGGDGKFIGRNVLASSMNGSIVPAADATRLTPSMAGEFYGAFGGTFGAPDASAANPKLLAETINLEQKRLQILGQIATADERVRLIEQQIQQAKNAGVTISQQEEQTVIGIARETAQQAANQFSYVHQLKESYGGVSTETAVATQQLRDQLAIVSATTAAEREQAQTLADVHALRLRGRDATEAQSLALDQQELRQATINAAVKHQTDELERQTELIQARLRGDEASVAAAQAYDRAIDAGADSLHAAALSAATLDRYNAQQESISFGRGNSGGGTIEGTYGATGTHNALGTGGGTLITNASMSAVEMMMAQQLKASGAVVPGFADGGVMTKYGPLPLKKYADGGVATSPQMAMFGEGSGPEAYVPLKGGAIPVSLNTKAQTQTPVQAAIGSKAHSGVNIGSIVFQGGMPPDTRSRAQVRRAVMQMFM